MNGTTPTRLTPAQNHALAVTLRAAADAHDDYYDPTAHGSYARTRAWDHMSARGVLALRETEMVRDDDVVHAFYAHIDALTYAHDGGLSGCLSPTTLRQASDALDDLVRRAEDAADARAEAEAEAALEDAYARHVDRYGW